MDHSLCKLLWNGGKKESVRGYFSDAIEISECQVEKEKEEEEVRELIVDLELKYKF